MERKQYTFITLCRFFLHYQTTADFLKNGMESTTKSEKSLCLGRAKDKSSQGLVVLYARRFPFNFLSSECQQSQLTNGTILQIVVVIIIIIININNIFCCYLFATSIVVSANSYLLTTAFQFNSNLNSQLNYIVPKENNKLAGFHDS